MELLRFGAMTPESVEPDVNSTMTLEEAHTKGFDLVREHSARFVAYARDLTDEQLMLPVPHLSWTVGETITHVQSVYERYTVDLRRAASPSEVGVQNAEDIGRIGVDVDRSTRSIETQVEHLAAVLAHIAPNQPFPFHAGVETTLAGGWGNLIGELLAHGDDIARATGSEFGVPGDDLEIVWRFTAPLLTGWLRDESTGLDESWDLRFSFGTIRLTITGGSLHHDYDCPPRPDHHEITIADAAEWTLAFPYQRRTFADPEPALLATRLHPL